MLAWSVLEPAIGKRISVIRAGEQWKLQGGLVSLLNLMGRHIPTLMKDGRRFFLDLDQTLEEFLLEPESVTVSLVDAAMIGRLLNSPVYKPLSWVWLTYRDLLDRWGISEKQLIAIIRDEADGIPFWLVNRAKGFIACDSPFLRKNTCLENILFPIDEIWDFERAYKKDLKLSDVHIDRLTARDVCRGEVFKDPGVRFKGLLPKLQDKCLYINPPYSEKWLRKQVKDILLNRKPGRPRKACP